MGINILGKVTDNVFGAVWLAALILTYERIVLKNQPMDVILKQSDIQAMAQKVCSKTVQSARISQWCNGDHPNSSYNYLRAIGGERKLTKVGEFNNSKEYPETLIGSDKEVFVIDETNKTVTYGTLLGWFVKEYSKVDHLNNQSKTNIDSNSVISLLKSEEPVIYKVYQNKKLEEENINSSVELHEDRIKEILKNYLENNGWKTQLAMGKSHGIDIDAYNVQKKRWIIEVKGCGSRDAMRVNYFLAILGETLQRMNDPNAKYSIALPDIQQFKNLWNKLPRLAKERTGITALFVSNNGHIEEEN